MQTLVQLQYFCFFEILHSQVKQKRYNREWKLQWCWGRFLVQHKGKPAVRRDLIFIYLKISFSVFDFLTPIHWLVFSNLKNKGLPWNELLCLRWKIWPIKRTRQCCFFTTTWPPSSLHGSRLRLDEMAPDTDNRHFKKERKEKKLYTFLKNKPYIKRPKLSTFSVPNLIVFFFRNITIIIKIIIILFGIVIVIIKKKKKQHHSSTFKNIQILILPQSQFKLMISVSLMSLILPCSALLMQAGMFLSVWPAQTFSAKAQSWENQCYRVKGKFSTGYCRRKRHSVTSAMRPAHEQTTCTFFVPDIRFLNSLVLWQCQNESVLKGFLCNFHFF